MHVRLSSKCISNCVCTGFMLCAKKWSKSWGRFPVEPKGTRMKDEERNEGERESRLETKMEANKDRGIRWIRVRLFSLQHTELDQGLLSRWTWQDHITLSTKIAARPWAASLMFSAKVKRLVGPQVIHMAKMSFQKSNKTCFIYPAERQKRLRHKTKSSLLLHWGSGWYTGDTQTESKNTGLKITG